MTSTAAAPTSRPITPRARSYRQMRLRYNRELITPEGAVLNLTIATFSERAGAFLIDFIIQWLTVLAVWYLMANLVNGMGYEGYAMANALMGVFIFAMRNYYFIHFEMGRRNATPGKRLLKMRVAARNGGQLKANAVFARNLVREIEIGLPLQLLFFGAFGSSPWLGLAGFSWAVIFTLFPLFNRDKLRVGDLIAGTWVIHTPKAKLLADIASSDRVEKSRDLFAFTTAQLDAYGIHELQVLEDVLRQSSGEIREKVASRIRKKIEWERAAEESDILFLESYYAALRRHLEQRMLFGQKKADKYDT